MKILKKIWENKIIVFLLIVLLFVVLLKLLPKPQLPVSVQKTPTPTEFPELPLPAVTPIVKPRLTPQPIPLSRATLDKIINQLPYQTTNFDVKYYPKTENFAVVIKKGPLGQTIKEVETWFQSQGATSLSQLKITWQPTREVLNEAGVPPPIPGP